jgi:hypothetical protein
MDPSVTFGEIISNDICEVRPQNGSIYTLTEMEAAHRVIRVTGAPTGTTVLVIQTPAVFRPSATTPPPKPHKDWPEHPSTIWRIIHNTTDHEVTVKATSADPGIVVAPNQSSILWSDGMKCFKPS